MILGLNYSGLHDSSITLLDDDGKVMFAASEERYSRVKKDGRFPHGSLARVSMDRVSHVAIPYLAEPAQAKSADAFFADVLLECQPPALPEAYPPEWRSRLDALGKPLIFVDHHLAHAATAFFLSGQPKALILTSDYSAHHCAWNMGLYMAGPDGVVPLHRASHAHYYPLCSLYSQVTALLGFRPNIHEGKITGLAAYGKHHPECEKKLWALHQEIGESSIPLYEWVGWLEEATAASLEVNPAVAAMFRDRLGDYSDAEIACAVQRLTERRVTTLLRRALELYPSPTVLLAGGLFANVKINLEVKRLGIKHLFICPPMGDEGIALGAAVLARAQLGLGEVRGLPVRDLFWGSTPAANAQETLDQLELHYKRPRKIPQEVAKLLAEGKTIALVQGRMEFGPRALGHRSILYQATDPTVNDWLNKKLHRTEFMPFAPIVRAEAAPYLFDNHELAGAEHTAEFMTICFSCRDRFRELCPAVVHVDGTARPQLVRADTHPELHAILTAYEQRTGLPALINTSFNVHDEPIVGSVRDAVVAFFQSELDYLVLDDCLLTREDNPAWFAATGALSGPALQEEKSLRKAITVAYGKRTLRQRMWVAELEKGKAWLEQQNAELQSWAQELDRIRNWLEEQRSSWQHTAEERGKLTQQQSEWSQKLEQAKVWLEQQATNWRQAAEKRGQIIEEQRAWTKSLEQGKNWLEQERNRWHQLAEEREQTILQQHQKLEQNHVQLEKQRGDWQRLASDKDKTIQEHLTAIQSLGQQLEASQSTVADKDKAIEQHRAGIRSLEQRLDDSQSTVADRNKALQQHQATIQTLELQLGNTRTLVQQLEATQQSLSEALQKLQGDFATLQQQMERQRSELQSRIERRETHIRDLEKRFFYRALVRLKLLPPPFLSEREPDSGEKKSNERQHYQQ
jgi:carbamoyltransferase